MPQQGIILALLEDAKSKSHNTAVITAVTRRFRTIAAAPLEPRTRRLPLSVDNGWSWRSDGAS